MPSHPKIVVVGSSNTDMVIRCPQLPSAGQTVLGGEFAMVPGGKGANQAVAASRLGANVAFIACVGSDTLGAQAIAGFEAEGIDTSSVFLVDAPTGIASIWVDERTGENRIIVASGANMRLTPGHIERCAALIASAQVLVCQLETPVETVLAALRIARAASVATILNPAPATDLPGHLLELVDYITPNEIEAAALCGAEPVDIADIARKLMAKGVKNVVVTLGAAGAYYLSAAGEGAAPAPAVGRVVDTTAAGDCFTGALAVRIAEGAALDAAVQFAVAAASISVTRPGAQTSLPTREET